VVGNVMTFAPLTVGPDEPLASAARKMTARSIGCLPVVDRQGELLGILTETDALRALIEVEDAADKAAVALAHGRVDALEHLARNLRLERAGILRQLGRFQEAERALAEAQRGDPVDLGHHSANTETPPLTGVLADRALSRLAEIDVALARSGQLGICVECEAPIPLCRLRALPGTVRCRDCAVASSSHRAPDENQDGPIRGARTGVLGRS
jgi:RNA polymerase-binding transcription factor DksA